MVSGVIFLDLKKAFDTVDHAILLKKLSGYGVQGQTASFFKSYLKDRQQFCVVNGLSSVKNRIVCGVPQGSLLGPLLFLIYINDLPNCLDHSIGRSFADDTNLTFSAVDLSILQTEMSNDLNRIFNWLSSNKLTLNMLKTYFMVIGSRQTYCCIVWDSIGETLVDSLQKLQNRAALVITGASYSKHSADIRHELGWLSLSEMRQHHMALMMFKVNHGLCPSYLSDMFDIYTSRLSYDLRSSGMNLIVPKARTNYFRNSFASAGAKLWNSLPSSLKEETSLKQFKAKIRSYLLSAQAS